MRQLALAVALPGCLYVGGGARATFDTKTWEPTYSGTGYFGGFTAQGQDDDTFGSVTDSQGFCFGLTMGAGLNQRLDRWEAIVGPRFGWLFPHGIAEFGFETRFSSDDPQLFSFLLRVGPRLEIARRDGDLRRAHVIQVPVHTGFTVGDGFRPELGAGVDYNLHLWRPGADFH